MPFKIEDLHPAGGVSSRDNPTTMPRNRYLMVHDLWPQADGSFRLRDGYTLIFKGLQPNVPIHSVTPFLNPTTSSNSGLGGGSGVTMPAGFVQGILSGTQDGNNKTFTLTPLPAVGFDPLIFWNELKLKAPISYSYSAGVVIFVDAPDSDVVLDAMVFVAS